MLHVLSHDELIALTGYTQHAKQLAELHRQGFYRARRCRLTGRVILERPHFEAICQGGQKAKTEQRPRLHKPNLKAA